MKDCDPGRMKGLYSLFTPRPAMLGDIYDSLFHSLFVGLLYFYFLSGRTEISWTDRRFLIISVNLSPGCWRCRWVTGRCDWSAWQMNLLPPVWRSLTLYPPFFQTRLQDFMFGKVTQNLFHVDRRTCWSSSSPSSTQTRFQQEIPLLGPPASETKTRPELFESLRPRSNGQSKSLFLANPDWFERVWSKELDEIRFLEMGFNQHLEVVWNVTPVGFLQMCLSLDALAVKSDFKVSFKITLKIKYNKKVNKNKS